MKHVFLIKWRQGPDMTIAVDWGVKQPFKQTFSFLLMLSILYVTGDKVLISETAVWSRLIVLQIVGFFFFFFFLFFFFFK